MSTNNKLPEINESKKKAENLRAAQALKEQAFERITSWLEEEGPAPPDLPDFNSLKKVSREEEQALFTQFNKQGHSAMNSEMERLLADAAAKNPAK